MASSSLALALLAWMASAQADETQAMHDAQNALHTDISTLSSRGSIRTVRNSGHCFQFDQPREVSDAVLEVVRATH